MAAIIGCSITTQCPQGSVSSQFNVDVKAGSQTHVCETLVPDDSFTLDVHSAPASLNIQSDFPVRLTLVSGEGDAVESTVVELDGTKKGGMPFFFLAGFAGLCDLDELSKVVIQNPAVKYNDAGTPLGKKAVFRVLLAAKA